MIGREGDERIAGGAGAGAIPRGGGGGGGPEEGPRDGRGGAEDAELLLESEREAAEDVRLGGGSKGAKGFVFRLTRLRGGGGGGGGSPL